MTLRTGLLAALGAGFLIMAAAPVPSAAAEWDHRGWYGGWHHGYYWRGGWYPYPGYYGYAPYYYPPPPAYYGPPAVTLAVPGVTLTVP